MTTSTTTSKSSCRNRYIDKTIMFTHLAGDSQIKGLMLPDVD